MATIEALKNLQGLIKKDLEYHEENFEIWKPLISLLEAYIINPQTAFSEFRAKTYFFNEFSNEIIQTLTKQTSFIKIDVFF